MRSVCLQLASNPNGLSGKMPGTGESVTIALCPGEWLAELQGIDFRTSSAPSQSTSKRYRGTSTLQWGNLGSKVDLGQCHKVDNFPSCGTEWFLPSLPHRGSSRAQVKKPSCSF